ncbi:hypothetical protein BN873_890056 [Candidatus Competibacter denitrificans Run_A_D11]|uniref:Uncharacterized protein n=1 Tax=Candidatus Competibacter denitrificans Run_A_D11 TaxID=1400863 RepID=W6MCM3_9GAMM|nr:hypothetical protein [Candidatus Competibacter denitrificans]CDI04150.1 hypothetical protein BN873_890056 [Candidatus Competibacter denitrificans Run_A_D11]HRC70005.1 hypothetical protein [Candidatus Competibacter denitrificans]
MRYKKQSPVTRAEVTPKILAAIERTENKPPHLVRDLLHLDEVQEFIHPDTRGPQTPAGYATPVGHFIDPETAVVARALVGVMLVVVGFVLGKVF